MEAHTCQDLSGPAVVLVIYGGSGETAVVQISDCLDFDLRQKIVLVCILHLDIYCGTVV